MPKPIRVLHIIESLRAGGKERQLTELLNGLEPILGIDCELAVMSEEIHYDRLPKLGAGTHMLIRRRRLDPEIFLRLDQLVRKLRPDIIHSWGSMCTVYAAPVAKLRGAKLVNGQIRDARANLDFRDADYRRAHLTLPISDLVVANSHAGLKAYRIPAAKGLCIYNGFDFSRVASLRSSGEMRREIGIATPYVVGMVATFSDLKDYASFFEAARIILAQRSDVTFVAVGDGPNLSRFRQEMQGNPFVRFLGTRKDVENIVSTFTVGALISNCRLHGEGISNAIMEYMALGKPVVATDAGGTSEIVLEGANGLLVPDGDIAAIAHCISNLIENADLAMHLGERGKARIKSGFTSQQAVEAYTALYKTLATDRRLQPI